MSHRPVKAAHVALCSMALALLCAAGFLWPFAHAQSTARPASEAADDRHSVPPAVAARLAAIDAERERLPAHPWAGAYYEGDGLGTNISISLAPRSGVAATWTGCMGLYGSNEGRIEEQASGRLRFHFTRANPPGFGGFPKDAVPVRWGERRYMIPGARMQDFINAIHHGSEPRPRLHGQFLLARGDEARPVSGLPALPGRLREQIRRTPLRVGVLKVAPRTGSVDTGFCLARYRVTVDHGDANGLVPGVALQPTAPAHVSATLVIDSATAGQASGEITVFESDCRHPRQVPDRTWTFTTGAYAAR